MVRDIESRFRPYQWAANECDAEPVQSNAGYHVRGPMERRAPPQDEISLV